MERLKVYVGRNITVGELTFVDNGYRHVTFELFIFCFPFN